MSKRGLGVAIISFDRPEYLHQLVESLEVQTALEEVDFRLFQDGSVSAYTGRMMGSAEGVAESVGVFEASELPRKTMEVRVSNAGIAVNQYEAMEYMVEHYERVVLLEDDVVVSPHYLRLAGVLFEQFEEESDLFSFCLGFKRMCWRYQVAGRLDQIVRLNGHWWGECLWSEGWDRVRPHYVEYYRLVVAKDYDQRPRGAIGALFRSKGWPALTSTQDQAKDMAINAAGMWRARLVVNRGISVGREGVHFSPRLFEGMGLGDQEPFDFDSDAHLEAFRWV